MKLVAIRDLKSREEMKLLVWVRFPPPAHEARFSVRNSGGGASGFFTTRGLAGVRARGRHRARLARRAAGRGGCGGVGWGLGAWGTRSAGGSPTWPLLAAARLPITAW